MAAAVSVPEEVGQGQSIDVVATGFIATNAISLAITGPEQSFILHDAATTDSNGDYTWTEIITLESLGSATWSVTDGTTTETGSISVFTD